MRVFVSYSHRDGVWVIDRLVPVLRAGGVDVVIDRERFRVGGSVIGQMDGEQDGAEKSLLVLSRDYLASNYCMHELRRAVARDSDFSRYLTLPVRLDDAVPPTELNGSIHADLADEARADQWGKVLDGCEGDLGCMAPSWLAARDALVRELGRHRSVNLVVRGDKLEWRSMLRDLGENYVPDLGLVDLQNPATNTRDGFALEIVRSLGLRVTSLARKPHDLIDFRDKILALKRKVRVGITHFDLFPHRRAYDIDLVATLRWLIMENERPLTLLVQSRAPFAELLPSRHPLSEIDMATVELA
jgi:hypothetical protein